MKTRFEKKGPFKIAGLAVHDGMKSDFMGIWEVLFSKVSMADLKSLGTGDGFGACYDFKTQELFSYMAGYDVTDEARARLLGLEVIEVPPAEYLVLELTGAVPKSIQAGWEYANGTYFVENNYRHAGTPDFEYYLEGNPSDPDYEMELWIPVVPKT